MRTRSAKPCVVTKAVRAPLRSSRALVATVEPWTTSVRAGAAMRARPARITLAGRAGFERSLKLSMKPSSRRTTKSVNVPPVSIPMRTIPHRSRVQERASFRHPLSSKKIMIRLTKVSKRFDGKRGVTALEDVDLEVGRGELVSIVGPSGSGKSTLLNLIGGLDTPSAGEIRIDGRLVSGLDDDELTRLRRDKIGFIFQFF